MNSYIRNFTSGILHHPLFSGTVVMVGGNMTANIINYFYHLVMGRVLGPVNYGVLASLYAIIYLIGIIPISASVSIVKFVSSTEENEVYSVYKAMKKFIELLATGISLLFLILSPFIAGFLRISNIWTVAMLSPILFFSLTTLVNQATAQGLLKFSGNVVPVLISSVGKFTLGILFIFLGWSVFGAMAGIVIGLSLAYIYSFLFIKRVLKKTKVDKYDLKPFLRYSLPVLLQALAFTSLFSTDVLLVKHFFDPFKAGIYAALSTLGKIIYFATSPVIATMFPIVSRRKARNESYRKIFFVAAVIVVGISVIVTVFYWLFPNIAIGVLYGEAYLSASAELVWMGIFMLFYSLTNLLINYSLSLGSSKIVFLPLIAAFVQVVLIWFTHSSILQVIQISLFVTLATFLAVLSFLVYNRSFNDYDGK